MNIPPFIRYFLIILAVAFLCMLAYQIFLMRGFEPLEFGSWEKYWHKFSCEVDSDCESRGTFEYCTNTAYTGTIKVTPWQSLPKNSLECQCSDFWVVKHCTRK